MIEGNDSRPEIPIIKKPNILVRGFGFLLHMFLKALDTLLLFIEDNIEFIRIMVIVVLLILLILVIVRVQIYSSEQQSIRFYQIVAKCKGQRINIETCYILAKNISGSEIDTNTYLSEQK